MKTFAALILLASIGMSANALPSRVDYTLAMPDPSSHLFHVTMTIDDLPPGGEYVDLTMPVWRPGRYVILDLPGGVITFGAGDGDGKDLRWRKTDKSTWRVFTGGAAKLTARYTVFADEFSIRTRGLNSDHGFVDGSAVFMYSEEYRRLPVRLTVTPYPGWHVTTGLEGKGNVFTSSDYDDFVDRPLEIGTQKDIGFEVRGVPHVLTIFGEADWNTDTLVRDITAIVEATADFWGDMPYDRYVFMVHLASWAGGATEHFNSTIIGGRPDRVVTPDGYRGFLGVLAHEYFHTWNVKRLRPKGIIPYDYTRENYLRELWIAEGMTSYYDDLILERSGIVSPEKYVEGRASWVRDDRMRPGNAVQSLSESSFDSWIKSRSAFSTAYNTETDFYSKGSYVSFMLDMTIRRATENRKSLDDVMRLMYRRFPLSGTGYTVDDLQAVASEEAGEDLAGFFNRYVHGTEPLPWEEMLGVAGIGVSKKDSAGKPWIGVSTRESAGGTTITRVVSGSPGSRAGLDAGDELVAVDGVKSDGDRLTTVLGRKTPGDSIRITVFRESRLREVAVAVRESPVPEYTTAKVSEPTDLQKKIFEDWLKTSWDLTASWGAAAPDTARRNVFIVVIDGVRFSEAFPLRDRYLPHIWNDLRPLGTIFNNFRNEGETVTCPGHASFLTGHYEDIPNDGSKRPSFPTLFELFRARTGAPESECLDVVGKKKLHILSYSTDPAYGEKYGATYLSPREATDTATWSLLSSAMDREHPRVVIVNLPSVDIAAHDSDWTGYLSAMRTADSLVYLLWTKIQSDDFYKNRTTMFVSSDHGRHEDAYGGFQNHGCPCEGAPPRPHSSRSPFQGNRPRAS